MKNWIDIKEGFLLLNSSCNYLVLRNFENYFDDLFIPGHEDIDVLCASKEDARCMTKLLDAESRVGIDDGVHYRFLFHDKYVDLDIRTTGDGYYDKNWVEHMLSYKEYNTKGFYTMNNEDYYYSLIYHAFYQKNSVSDEYIQRLNEMAELTGFSCEKDYEIQLFDYMKQNKYYYTVPVDRSVICTFKKSRLCKPLVRYPLSIRYKRFSFLFKRRIRIIKFYIIHKIRWSILSFPKVLMRCLLGNNYEKIKQKIKKQ